MTIEKNYPHLYFFLSCYSEYQLDDDFDDVFQATKHYSLVNDIDSIHKIVGEGSMLLKIVPFPTYEFLEITNIIEKSPDETMQFFTSLLESLISIDELLRIEFVSKFSHLWLNANEQYCLVAPKGKFSLYSEFTVYDRLNKSVIDINEEKFIKYAVIYKMGQNNVPVHTKIPYK